MVRLAASIIVSGGMGNSAAGLLGLVGAGGMVGDMKEGTEGVDITATGVRDWDGMILEVRSASCFWRRVCSFCS